MKKRYLFLMLLAVFAVVGVVAARYPGNVAAGGGETAVSAQTTPTDEDINDEDYPDPFTAAAEAIGITEDQLWEALDSGKTIAEVAQDNGVDVQKVIDAMVAAENSFIDQLLADGEIDAAEANEWRSEVVEYITESVNEVMDDEYFEEDFDEDFDEDFVDPTVTAAELIGIDEDALWEALEAGKSIADVANENNVDPQTIIDALVAEESAWIDELLADGEIDEAEAEEWRAEAAEYTAEFVNEVWDFEEFEDFEDGVELYLPAECVLEADGTALADLEIPEACEDGFAVFGAAMSD